MEETSSPSSSPSPNHTKTFASHLKNSCLSFAVSIQETFRYAKASLVGQAKTITAKDEKKASEAELETSKKQVEAADAAEDIKNKLSN